MNVNTSAARPHEATSLAEQAYVSILDQIMLGEIPLGAPLSRRGLAGRLGMSLVPVAEALQRLEGEGLVESRPRIGTRVCRPSVEEIRGRFEVREALEAQIARLFAEKASQREKDEIMKAAEAVDQMYDQCFSDRAGDRGYILGVHRLHSDLHTRIAQCTGCQPLCRAIERNHILMFNWLFDTGTLRSTAPWALHADLVRELNEGDPDRADRAMREHVRSGLENVLAHVRQGVGPV